MADMSETVEVEDFHLKTVVVIVFFVFVLEREVRVCC